MRRPLNMDRDRSGLLLAFLVGASVLGTDRVAAQAPAVDAPYSMEELLFLVNSPMADARVGSLVAEGCLSFEMDAFSITELRQAGASLELIGTLNEACVVQEAAPAQPPVTTPPPATSTPASTATPAPATTTRRLSGPGFYGSNSWLRLHYGSIDETRSGGISWGTMSGDFAEFGLWGAGSKTPIAGTGGPMGLGEMSSSSSSPEGPGRWGSTSADSRASAAGG